MSAYLVCDSIHQLSHAAPTHKTNKEIAEFLGVDNSHVGAMKMLLVQKGLIFDDERGCQTTEKWSNAVTFASGKIPLKMGKSQQKWENPIRTLYKEGKEVTCAADAAREIVDEEQPAPKVSRAKYPHAKGVFALWGKYPKHWERNKTQCQAAEDLLTEIGNEEVIASLDFLKKNKHHEFCPEIHTPHDLLTKYAKLEAFSNKNI